MQDGAQYITDCCKNVGGGASNVFDIFREKLCNSRKSANQSAKLSEAMSAGTSRNRPGTLRSDFERSIEVLIRLISVKPIGLLQLHCALNWWVEMSSELRHWNDRCTSIWHICIPVLKLLICCSVPPKERRRAPNHSINILILCFSRRKQISTIRYCTRRWVYAGWSAIYYGLL
jgi:hypothetical protein